MEYMMNTISWDVMLCSMRETTLNNVPENYSVWVVLPKIKGHEAAQSLLNVGFNHTTFHMTCKAKCSHIIFRIISGLIVP
jgi:hypothetical protein